MSEELRDEDLLRRFEDGDLEAIDALRSRHEAALFAFVARSTFAEIAQVEEATLDLWRAALERAPEFHATSPFAIWLYSNARVRCAELRRRRPPVEAGLPARAVGIDASRTLTPLEDALHEAIDDLPDEQRDVYLLHLTGRLSFREIAEVCAVPESTARNRVRYALERLQRSVSRRELHAEERV